MKKFIAILLFLCYSLASVGATITLHLCGGETKSVMLYDQLSIDLDEADNCCSDDLEEEEPEVCFSDQITSESCCQDQIFSYKLSSNTFFNAYKLNVNKEVAKALKAEVLFPNYTTKFILEEVSESPDLKRLPDPPIAYLIAIPYYQLYQQLKIYDAC